MVGLTTRDMKTKTIEVSYEAFALISHLANKHANGDVVEYIDRLVGVRKERRDYEELPIHAEIQFLKTYHPEKHSNPEIACAILDVIRREAPRRFESIVGFRYPNREHVAVSRHIGDFSDPKLTYRIGNSDVYIAIPRETRHLKELLHELLITIGYSTSAARSFGKYIRRSSVTESMALKYLT